MARNRGINRASQGSKLDRIHRELAEMLRKAIAAGWDPDENAYSFHLRNALTDIGAAGAELYREREERRAIRAQLEEMP